MLIPLSTNFPARRVNDHKNLCGGKHPFSGAKKERRGFDLTPASAGILSSWPARIGNHTSRAAAAGEFHPLADPCAGVIWAIPQTHTDQSRFFLSNIGQFPLSALKKEGRLPSVPYMKSLRQIFNSSKSHRTATQKFWCFTLRRNPKELSRSLSHQFSSGCQLPADFEEACTHLKDFYMHDSLQQEKHCSSSRERRGHCKLLRFWNPLIKLQLSQNLILTGATSTRCQRKTWFGVGNFGFF